MKAIIFAAGMGTRLKPVTDFKPKALTEIGGITLLELAVNKLIKAGIFDIIINVHHFADQIIQFLKEKNNFGINICISDERDELLDTGGGLIKASWFFNDNKPFIAYNVDVLSDIDLGNMFESHKQSHAIATVAIRNRETSRYLLFDDIMHLCGWENKKTGELKIIKGNPDTLTAFAFSGVQILNPKIFSETKLKGKFSMIDLYLEIAVYNNIFGFTHNEGYWFDLGKPENFIEAELMLKYKKVIGNR